METIKQCAFCGNDFTARRRDAAFCGNLCRAHHHNNNVKQPPVADQLVRTNARIQNPQIQAQQNGLLGLFEDPRITKLQEKIEKLQEEKQDLKMELLEAKANVKLNEQMEAFKIEQGPQPENGLMGFIDKVSANDKLLDLAGTVISRFIDKGNNSSADEGIFAGIEPDRVDNLKALIEISKGLPDEVIEVLLGAAGSASQDPEQFLEGIRLQNEGSQTQVKAFIP